MEVVKITTTRYTLAELLDMFEVDAKWLIEESGLNSETVRRALDDSPTGLKTHVTSAYAMAHSFGLTPDEIKWPRGLCQNGRPAHTGDIMMETTITVTHRITVPTCPVHFIALPATGICGDCE